MTDQDDSRFASLVVEAVERLQSDGPGAIDAICEEHPDWADALRSAIAPLAAIGLAPSATESTGGAPLGPGRTFADGEFEIVREIGRGGMGVVFEAIQGSLGRRVALKLLAQPLELDPTAVQRFEREARTAASLNHSGIAEVFAFGVDAGIHYLAMELVEGTPLDVVIRQTREASTFEGRGKALPGGSDHYLRTTLEIVEKVAIALAYAHRRGIVHRDIKPSNILLRPDGTPVITDFGLAQKVDLPALTRTGAFVGTPHYTAPEQHSHGGAEIDGRADVFSLGVTLYEMLTDRRPFGGETTQEVLRRVATIEPADPQTVNPRLPTDVAAIVLRALEKDPAARYATAEEFAADLRAFLEFRPVAAKRAGTATKVRRWVRREPLRAAFFGLLVVSIPAVAALAGYIAANRPLVAAAERQATLDGAEASLLAGYVEGLSHGHAQTMAVLEDALAHPATRAEALILLSLEQMDTDAASCLATLAAHPFDGDEPRAITRLRGMCHRTAGDVEAAQTVDTELGEPTTALEHFLLGKWIFNHGTYTHKTDRSERALEHFRLAAMLSKSPRPTILHSLAVVAGNTGQTATGRAAVGALMEQWPDHAFAWEAEGFAFESVDPERAIAAYRRAIELAEGRDATRAWGNLGNLYCEQDRVAEARECLDEAIRLNSRNSFAHGVYAYMNLFRDGGSLDAAIDHAGKAIEFGRHTSDLMRGYRLKVRALAEAGRALDAVAVAEAGLERLPGERMLEKDRLNALITTGDWTRVLAACDAVSEHMRDDDAVFTSRAEALTALGRLADAVETLHERALADPKDPMKWHDLALGTMKRDDCGDRVDAALALEACRRSNALSAESDPYLVITYATICLDFAEFEEADRLLKIADRLLAEPRWQRAAETLREAIVARREKLAALREAR